MPPARVTGGGVVSLGNPWGLLALGLAGPLVLWYLLRSRRPRMTVASTFLWQQTQRSVAAAVPWQRFRPDLTFWLVLLAIVAGALALSQPYLSVPAVLGDHTILVVDASGSMLADEDGPTRLELARSLASGPAVLVGHPTLRDVPEGRTANAASPKMPSSS